MKSKKMFIVGMLGIVFAGFSQPCPSICVMIPEEVLIERIPRRVPDPAAETAIIQAFREYGFTLVDQTQAKSVRELHAELIKTLGKGTHEEFVKLSGEIREKFVADILIVGEALATVVVFEAFRFPGQLYEARARVEVRAIDAWSGEILAADALHAGGLDFSPELAAKAALARAGEKIACRLAESIVKSAPKLRSCYRGCTAPKPEIGIFSVSAGVPVCVDQLFVIFPSFLESTLTSYGCKLVRSFNADYLLTVTLIECKEVKTQFGGVWAAVILQITVSVQVLELRTGQIQTFQVSDTYSGIEAIGQRFRVAATDVARSISEKISAKMCELNLCICKRGE